MKKRRILSILLAITMILSCLPGELGKKTGMATEVEAETIPHNPKIERDDSMYAKQKVTYDCIWFGSYPQTEIVDRAKTSGMYDRRTESETDYEVNTSLYNVLLGTTDWVNDEITIGGVKYRRLDSNKHYSNISEFCDFYLWDEGKEDEDKRPYHYFRYEPIKWRVLNVTGSKAFLLSDTILDFQEYYDVGRPTEEQYWGISQIRSWLNGYDETENLEKKDYSKDNFIDYAFSDNEKTAILSTTISDDAEGINETKDRIFLPSLEEMCSPSYGFHEDLTVFDEAGRRKSSCYAKALGLLIYFDASPNDSYNMFNNCSYNCNSDWMLRTNNKEESALYCTSRGQKTFYYPEEQEAVCPAINLDLSTNLWSYAGTFCTKDIVNGEGSGSGGSTPDIKPEVIDINNAKVVLSATSYTFDGRTHFPTIKTIGGSVLVQEVDYTTKYSKADSWEPGTYTVTVTGKGNYIGTTKASYKINKAPNPLTVNKKTVNIKFKKVKKKAQTLTIKTTKAQGKVTYKSSNKKVKVTAKGKVTVKKETKKGKYKITVTAAGNGHFNKGVQTVMIVVK